MKMKFKELCVVFCGVTLMCGSVSAAMYDKRSSQQSNLKDFLARSYVGVKGGYVNPVGFSVKPDEQIKKDDATGMYGVMAGYRINQWWRSDLELSQRHKSTAKSTIVTGGVPDTKETAVSSTMIMWNNYLMLPQMYAQPFINLGFGMARNKMSDYKESNIVVYGGDTRNAFAYQFGAGITFSHQNLDVDGMLQYVNRGEARTKSGSGTAPRTAIIKDIVLSLGLRYNL